MEKESKYKQLDSETSDECDNSVKGVTSRILKLDANTIKLSFATLICIMAAMTVLTVSSLPIYLFSKVDQEGYLISPLPADLLSVALAVLGTLFVFFPCIGGFMHFAKCSAEGERPSLITVFSPFFEFKRYLRSYAVLFTVLMRIAIILLPLAGGIMSLPMFSDMSQMSIFQIIAKSAFVLGATAAAVAVGAFVASYLFFAPYLMLDGMKLWAAMRASVRMSRTRHDELVKQTLSHSGELILSVLSFGVLWVFYSAPRMSVSYFVYCGSLFSEGRGNGTGSFENCENLE